MPIYEHFDIDIDLHAPSNPCREPSRPDVVPNFALSQQFAADVSGTSFKSLVTQWSRNVSIRGDASEFAADLLHLYNLVTCGPDGTSIRHVECSDVSRIGL